MLITLVIVNHVNGHQFTRPVTNAKKNASSTKTTSIFKIPTNLQAFTSSENGYTSNIRIPNASTDLLLANNYGYGGGNTTYANYGANGGADGGGFVAGGYGGSQGGSQDSPSSTKASSFQKYTSLWTDLL